MYLETHTKQVLTIDQELNILYPELPNVCHLTDLTLPVTYQYAVQNVTSTLIHMKKIRDVYHKIW